MSGVTEKLQEIARETLSGSGFELVDLRYGRRGRKWYIQVFADREGGVTIDDCVFLSERLEYELDREKDLLSHSYNLEVSSPGLDRPLKNAADFKKYAGHEILFKLYEPLEDARNWKGTVVDITDDGHLIFDDKNGRRLKVELSNIASANLEVKI